MSDLIDFDSPTSPRPAQSLASPLIPSPEAGPPESSSSSSSVARRSIDSDNPFDMVMKKIAEYERNKEDPFERVCERAMGRVSIESSKDDFVPRRKRHSDILKLNKTLDDAESKMVLSLVDDMSIITDLNDTNLIADNVDAERASAWDCDKKTVPELNVSPSSCDADLSILNQSAMNDSLLDEQLTKEPSASLFLRPRSMSQCNFFSPEKLAPPRCNRRSMSVTDATKNSIPNADSSIASAQSSLFDDPLNNAFRNTLKNSASSSVSGFSSQFDLSTSRRVDRLNSDSSVFSGLSNISAITTDTLSKVRQDRFGSESSNYSNISNLSIIPNNTVTSSDSSVFVNDTMNKGFVASRSQLSSASSVGVTPSKAADRSDLITKFYQIKSRMSVSQTGARSNNSTLANEKEDRSLRKHGGKLIDLGNSSAPVSTNDSNISDIIFNEARTLAETFEKMASSKGSNTTDDDLLFSKTQLNFDDLPPSDDEAVDNLIELSGGESEIKKSSQVDTKSNVSPEDEVKALENEFIDHKNADKKAAAATLLLDLEKLLKEQDNPEGFKVLTDLQKMLGVECDNNTEILQACLQNSMSPQDGKKSKTNGESSKSITDNNTESSQSTSNHDNGTKEISENKSSSSNDITDLNIQNESKDIISDNVYSQVDSKKESTGQNNDNAIADNQKLTSNLLQSLNKIVSKTDEDSAVDVLKALGTILSMASELHTKNKDKPVPEEKENKKMTVPKQMIRSVSSLYKSPSKKNPTLKKTQNSSLETLPLRKSISVNPVFSNSSSNLLDVPNNKRKSHLLNLKKRFPSDPGFADAADKKRLEPKTTPAAKATVEPIKPKLKKSNSTVVSKKGPMKAIIPLGSMQKHGVKQENNETGAVTPPSKVHGSVPLKIVSSTPNSSGNSKSKPTASSTPNGLKIARVKPSPQNSSKGTMTCSLSPVSLNSSSKTNTSRKSELSKSPRKAPSTPRRSETTESSRLPRYSPRPVRVRNYSLSDTKSTKSPQPASLKVASEKAQRHSSVLSPRNCNKLATKAKPMSLMPKLSKSIASKSGPEKENYA